MPYSLLFISYLLLQTIFPPDNQQFLNEQEISTEKEYLYIYAPNGLNMREGPTVSYGKLTKIPYGAKVELIVPAAERNITVDGLLGGMAKVAYGGYTGYAFDGYMSQFRAPEKQSKVRDYVEILRQDGHLIYYEKTEKDFDGYFRFEESIILHKSDWAEAFLVAKQLFAIPEKLYFPVKNNKTESTYVNPDKPSFAWSDELTVTRENGHIASMTYTYRLEGGGTGVSIQYYEPDSEAIKITRIEIAD